MTILGIFSMRGERYYFTQDKIEPTWGEIEMNIGKLGRKLGKTQISFSGGGDFWWWYLIGWGWRQGAGVGARWWGGGTGGGISDMGMGFQSVMEFQTWRWSSRHWDGVSDMGMGFQSGMGFQTWRWGSRLREIQISVPDMGVGFQTRGGVQDMRVGFQTWERGSRQGVGFLTWEWGSRNGDGVPDRGISISISEI